MGKYLYKKTREAFYDLIDDRGVIQETDFINWMNKIIKEKYPNNFDNRIEIHTFTMIKKLCEHLKINAISVSPVLIKGMYEIESIIFELDNMKILNKRLEMRKDYFLLLLKISYIKEEKSLFFISPEIFISLRKELEYLICLRNFYKNEFSIEEAEKIMRISKNIECENRMMNIFKNKDITSYKTHVLYEMRKGEEIIEKLVEVLKIDKDEIDEILGISPKKYKVLEILKEITNSKENSITEFVYKYFDEKDKEIFFYEYYVKLNSYCHFQVEDVPSRHFLVGSLDEINSPGENIDEFYFDKEFKVKLIVIEGMLKIVNELYNELNS